MSVKKTTEPKSHCVVAADESASARRAKRGGAQKPIPYKLTSKVPKETDIQAQVLKALGVEWRDEKGKLTGIYRSSDGMFWRQNCGVTKRFVRFAPNGTADILGCIAGVFVAFEVKRPGEDQSQAQVAWQRIVEDSGGIYRVVRSWQEALDVVQEVRNG